MRSYLKVNEKMEENEYARYREQLWTAPEILRQELPLPRYGTQKADVYSYAIILQEIIYRALPFFLDANPEGKREPPCTNPSSTYLSSSFFLPKPLFSLLLIC